MPSDTYIVERITIYCHDCKRPHVTTARNCIRCPECSVTHQAQQRLEYGRKRREKEVRRG